MNDQQGHEDSEMSDKDLTMEEEYPQDLEKKNIKISGNVERRKVQEDLQEI